MSENSIETIIVTLTTLSEALNTLLRDERDALVARDLAKLATLTDEKTHLCAKIDHQVAELGDTPLSAQIAAAPAELHEELDGLHKNLIDAATRTQEYNLVNGKIAHRSQQSVRELISLMSGTDTEQIYGERGHTEATAQGTAIAEA